MLIEGRNNIPCKFEQRNFIPCCRKMGILIHKSYFTNGKIPFVLRLPNNKKKKNNNNKVTCRPAHYVLAGKKYWTVKGLAQGNWN